MAYRHRDLVRQQFVAPVRPEAIYARDKGLCGICGEHVDNPDFALDHVIPLSRGGVHAPENCQTSHRWCNHRKGAMLPDEVAAWRAWVEGCRMVDSDQDIVDIVTAARMLGISEQAVRKRLQRGSLTGGKQPDGRWYAVIPRGDIPSGHGQDTQPDPAIMPSATQQLEVVRDTLLRPLIEQNERQQAIIAEQAETIGRVTAERDALQGRVSALEARQTAQGTSGFSAPQTATDAATGAPWWQFWKR